MIIEMRLIESKVREDSSYLILSFSLSAALSTRDLTQSEQADARIIEAEGRRKASEDKFVKLKTVYEKFRAEHLAVCLSLHFIMKWIGRLCF